MLASRSHISRNVSVGLTLACLAIATACVESVTEPLPTGGVQFDAPPIFALWWKKVEACSGRSGSLASVQWYVVPGVRTIPDGKYGEVGAYTDYRDRRIVLAGEVQMLGPLVRHEMLHELLQAPGHPRRYFLEQCTGIVDCTGTCVEEAGPPPAQPASVPRVPGDSFDVSIRVEPEHPGVDTLGGRFMVIVTARNPSTHSVVLRNPPPPNPLPPYTFGWLFGDSGPNLGFVDNAWDLDAAAFAAGETKQEIFDFAVDQQRNLMSIEPGTYQMRGFFEVHATPPFTFTVSP
jgi:hypothetical protein